MLKSGRKPLLQDAISNVAAATQGDYYGFLERAFILLLATLKIVSNFVILLINQGSASDDVYEHIRHILK